MHILPIGMLALLARAMCQAHAAYKAKSPMCAHHFHNYPCQLLLERTHRPVRVALTPDHTSSHSGCPALHIASLIVFGHSAARFWSTRSVRNVYFC